MKQEKAGPPPYLKIFLKVAFRVLLLGLLLFLPARSFHWAAGWVYLVLYAAWSALTIILLARRSPALLLLREAEIQAASESWDRALMFLGGVLLAVLLLVCSAEAALPGVSVPLSAAAFLCICAAYGLFTWALLSNRFAVGVAVLQAGQVPVDKGPYCAVRHPLYLAAIVIFSCTPAALGSTGGFVPGGLLAAAVVLRTALEDRLLLRSLPGYREYASRVPYRLLPGFW
ncbi:MAG: isoprenylcysteine carboxylmethyltransferase family protein [Elusimicrobiota bacterium]|nr:isoprenylcysteine carboxylmethyltransferase family protein [Elusimicrobiota bacterium]